MKLSFRFSKRITLASSAIVLVMIGIGASQVIQKPVGADTNPIVTEVDHQNDILKNHEARITNLETDTKNLQTNTNTQPSTNKQLVPEVRSVNGNASGSATTTISPDAPIVVSYKEIPIDANNSDCEYTYSDGTIYQFHWKVNNPQGSWITDSFGQNGHWVSTVYTTGVCDQSAIGQAKQ